MAKSFSNTKLIASECESARGHLPGMSVKGRSQVNRSRIMGDTNSATCYVAPSSGWSCSSCSSMRLSKLERVLHMTAERRNWNGLNIYQIQRQAARRGPIRGSGAFCTNQGPWIREPSVSVYQTNVHRIEEFPRMMPSHQLRSQILENVWRLASPSSGSSMVRTKGA